MDHELADPRRARLAIREGRFRDFTNHAAPGFIQGNLMIVPAAFADDFEQFARLNPLALPLLARGEAGDPTLPAIAEDFDIRSDVGGYMIYRDGELAKIDRAIHDIWRDDLVSFVIGCSFSFEPVLMKAGIRLRHIQTGNVSAMYVTNRATAPAGRFGGPLVVSMRPLPPEDAARASALSALYPEFHGAPIHQGDPAALGITLDDSYGGHGLKTLENDEIPVFWRCGATAQLAAREARLPLCITHYKAHMVLTDLPVPQRTMP